MTTETGFIFGDDAYKVSLKSLKALKAHLSKADTEEEKEDSRIAIHLIIHLANPIVKSTDYIPRIITLPNKIDKISGKHTLLITKDPSTPYRDALLKKGSPTEDYISEIITLRKLKKIASNRKNLEKIYNEYDLILCDHRIQKFMPSILGVKFLKNKSKVPFMIQMSRPDMENKLVRLKRSNKLKDENCDADYVAKQLKLIARNTKFVPHENGQILDIKIGYNDMDNIKLVENIDTILKYIIDNKNTSAIVGVKTTEKLIKGGSKMYQDVHIKTSESISLPIYKSST